MKAPWLTGFGACLIGVLLGACADSTGIRPAVSLREANTISVGADIAAGAVSAGAWPEADWWNNFRDPQLDTLIERALAANPRLAIATSRIAEAEALVGNVRAATQPVVSAGTSSIHTHFSENHIFPAPLGGGDFWDNGAQLALSYKLDLWGRDEKNLEASLAEVQVRKYEELSARLALTTAIVRSYAAFALQFELSDNYRAILQNQKNTLTVVQRRISAGISTEFEAQEIIADIAANHAAIEQIDAHIAILRHALGALTGEGPAAGDVLTRPNFTLNQPVALPTKLPAELIGRRPDILAERWRVERAADNIDVAKTAFYPNIDLRAAVGFASLGFSKFFDATSENSEVGPAISLPIFDGGQRRSQLKARTAEYDAAVQSYNATLLDALTTIADQISTLDSLQHVALQREEAKVAAARAQYLAQQAFSAGLTDSLNVLHTQSMLSTQRNFLAEVHFQRILAWTTLNQALGGGLVPANKDVAIEAK